MVTFRVYIRQGCHLCEDLLWQLGQLRGSYAFEIVPLDVDSDTKLVEQYGTEVPVVMYGDRKVCHYFLDMAAIEQILSSTNN
ncbi:MAG: glutaredoxin family protein [Gammaproteobacteria bacterium]|nr:glutaredoxin family protein [Gammaproteobacteria bacterium]MDH5736483.1 glutaredoxin family protein [Gammaproteobacteria bacterium]